MTEVQTIIFYFFFNDTATTEIYTLSLHDALPILVGVADELHVPDPHRARHLELRDEVGHPVQPDHVGHVDVEHRGARGADGDRKSTRLNSSHANISYAVFCLKKKKRY